jgi:hypothetical protein
LFLFGGIPRWYNNLFEECILFFSMIEDEEERRRIILFDERVACIAFLDFLIF